MKNEKTPEITSHRVSEILRRRSSIGREQLMPEHKLLIGICTQYFLDHFESGKRVIQSKIKEGRLEAMDCKLSEKSTAILIKDAKHTWRNECKIRFASDIEHTTIPAYLDILGIEHTSLLADMKHAFMSVSEFY